jgi:protein-S-isoprenylcysteine O-methyltransferase Ste14
MLFLKNLLFTVLVPGTVAVYVPIRMAGGGPALASAPWGAPRILALPLLVLGAATYLRCVWDFGTKGRGTPAPIDAPRELVVAGLYRYVRNPMYVGVLSLVTGWAIFFRSWGILLYGCALALAFHLFVVFYEEPRLRRQFGESYERYRRAVGRWIPGRAHERST